MSRILPQFERHAIPDALLQSPVMTSGGFRVYTGLPDADTCGNLLNEALTLYRDATPQETEEDDGADGRGGKPRRRFLSAQAGPVQDALYRSAYLTEALTAEFGLPIVASGNRGSYSYYARPGDFLDLHLDVLTCDVAMITVLHDNSAPTSASGALQLYPGRIGEPLSAVRARPNVGDQIVKLLPGQTIVLFGGLVPHRLLSVAAGQVRIISVLCFEACPPEPRVMSPAMFVSGSTFAAAARTLAPSHNTR